MDGDGVVTAGTVTTHEVSVVAIPGGADRENDPEGLRAEADFVFYVAGAVHALYRAVADGDVIVYRGERWRVFEAQPWGNPPAFTEARCIRQAAP